MSKSPKRPVVSDGGMDSAYQVPAEVLGEHPSGELFGSYITAKDGETTTGIPHRSLIQEEDGIEETVSQLRAALIRHHASPKMIARDRRKIMNLRRQGYPISDAGLHRFPKVDNTQKGNLAEVFLAEYLIATTNADLPVYRFHENTNPDESMKGDDVLAFDFTSQRPRIIVGEAKFRKKPDKKSVEDIVSGLVRSHQIGLPVSLVFVEDTLYKYNKDELADRISNCSLQMAEGKLDLYYIGLLLSTRDSKIKVDQHTDNKLRSLVMISLGMDDPEKLLRYCFEKIEEEAYADPD